MQYQDTGAMKQKMEKVMWAIHAEWGHRAKHGQQRGAINNIKGK